MKQSVKSVVMLLVVCGVIALSLAVTNYITSPIIAQKEAELIKESLLVVMPDGGEFKELDISSAQLPKPLPKHTPLQTAVTFSSSKQRAIPRDLSFSAVYIRTVPSAVRPAFPRTRP